MNTEATTAAAAADILLLAQHPDDARVVRSAAPEDRLHVLEACGRVLPFLRREREFGAAPRPNLIILDLDLNDEEHCDTLLQIKKDPDLRRIPLVVISDRARTPRAFNAYDLHANAYVEKPRDPGAFLNVVRATLDFWLKLARLPGEPYA